jgi:hypothetical protein
MTVFFIILFATACQNKQDQKMEYGWFDFVIPDSDTTATPVDMSFLNEKVAGGAGFVSVKDGHFFDGNGNRIRFFGTNLTFSSCFTDKETAKNIAGRLRKLGMNVVRFHHMDNQSAPGGIWNKDKRDLDPVQLDKLDWLVYQLKIHGIYSNLNTHVSFTYPGVDYKNVEQFNFGKTIDQFYPPYIEMQKDYARKLLTHKNPYTGKTYAEEPAVAFVEVNNENSLISNWALLPELNEQHKAELIRQWKIWLNSRPEYRSKEGFSDDLLSIITNYNSGSSESAKEIMWSFLKDTEMQYAREMTSYYKNDLKIKALLCETQAYYSGVAGVAREAEVADFIDMHSYWEHPDFPGRSWSSTDWTIRNSSMVSDKRGGTLLSFGQHRVAGMPLTISEYDHPAPSYFCAEMFPMLNSVSAFQDFDGIYHFTFDHPYDKGRIDNFFSNAGHPLKQVFVPVGAVLFRMGAVKPGENPVHLNLPAESVVPSLVKFGDKISLHVSNMRYIWDEAGAPASLISTRPMNVIIGGTGLKLSETVEEPSEPWVSETGEIEWDNADSTQAVFKINAPSAKGAIGYIGGKNIDLGNVTVAMEPTPNNWAVITLTSLDGKPVEESSKVLLVAAGKAENTDWQWNENKTSLGRNWGNAPTRVEGIPAKIIFRNTGGFKVQSLDPAGSPSAEIITGKKGKEIIFGIGAQYKTLWYLISRE